MMRDPGEVTRYGKRAGELRLWGIADDDRPAFPLIVHH